MIYIFIYFSLILGKRNSNQVSEVELHFLQKQMNVLSQPTESCLRKVENLMNSDSDDA